MEQVLVHEKLTSRIIGAAIRVHRSLGPGLLESAYETCLVHELISRRLRIQRRFIGPVLYGAVRIDTGYRIDLLVEDRVIVELKSVDRIDPIHEAQLLTYLRLADKPVGLLINFNVLRLRDGIVRRALTGSIQRRSLESGFTTSSWHGPTDRL